jgi:hypothetical protein
MRAFKINKTDYKSATQEGLFVKSDNIAVMCADPMYDAVRTEHKAVVVASEQYGVALQEAVSGDKVKGAIKREKKATLLAALDVLATVIEWNAQGSEVYFKGTGFNLNDEPRVANRNASLATPTILRASSNGIRGELQIVIELDSKSGMKQMGFEYSTNKGETWTNGTYSGSTKFIWDKLPSSSEVMLRTRAIGSFNRKSEWSEIVTAAVL